MSTTDEAEQDEAATDRAAQEESFWKIGKENWKTVLKSTGKQFASDQVATLSASVTLRIVLSLVPALIAAIAIGAQVISTADIEELVSSANSIVPGESAQDFVSNTVQDAIASLQDQGLSALLISIGAGLFAASSAAVQLIKALNVAYDVEENRGFIGQRFASLAVIGALVLALAGMFVAIVLGPSLLELVLPANIIESPLNILITLGRFVAAVLILMGFFGFAFWYGPDRERPKLRFLSPGAVSGVIGWLVLSYLFSLYVRTAGSYNATYGAVAGIVVLLIWLNYSFIVLLMGAELDSELEKFIEQRRIERSLTAIPGSESEMVGSLPAAPRDAPTLDDVSPDMPRHPELMAASRPATRSEDEADPDQVDTGAAAPSPAVLMGAARKTSGASIAAALWGRMRD
ncbi:YihY/virulence factor BrkB family protein [Euzebya tangerina]|uniref:YihY/virulence factor BrkB family protein n=1 Tax=Euzebya tangerina TaxID=591198 RepID=UPI0013C2AE48|nr:YihY/virulence factor BrkB family protein [Euzebya tangerina]